MTTRQSKIPIPEGNQRFDFRRVRNQFRLHSIGLIQRPLNVQIIFIVGIVRRAAWFDEHGLNIIMEVKEYHGVPFCNQFDGCPGFRLALGKSHG